MWRFSPTVIRHADDCNLAYGRVPHQHLLHCHRRDVFTANDDDVFATVANLEVAIRVHHRHIASVQPAAAYRRISCLAGRQVFEDCVRASAAVASGGGSFRARVSASSPSACAIPQSPSPTAMRHVERPQAAHVAHVLHNSRRSSVSIKGQREIHPAKTEALPLNSKSRSWRSMSHAPPNEAAGHAIAWT